MSLSHCGPVRLQLIRTQLTMWVPFFLSKLNVFRLKHTQFGVDIKRGLKNKNLAKSLI